MFYYSQKSISEESYQTGCKNTIEFTHSFETEDGASCNDCAFSMSSTLRDMFIPSLAKTCVTCAGEDSACSRLSITTSFQDSWKM